MSATEPTIPRPVPAADRPLRIVLCRACGQPTGYPGAAFCDRCRPHALQPEVLFTDVDWQLDAIAQPDPDAAGVAFLRADALSPAGCWVLTLGGVGDTRRRFDNLADAITALREVQP